MRGILVNGRGQRYVAEDTYPGRIGQLTLYHQDNTAYLIIDGDAQEEAMAVAVRDAVPDAAADVGLRHGRRTGDARSVLPPGSLQATVAAYNDGAARGEDPLLHKKPEWLKPIGIAGRRDRPAGKLPAASPSAACRPRWTPRCCTSAVKPIPGLFAAGRSTAGLAAWGYASGVSLGDGSFYGRRAGRAAAKG